MIQIVTDSTCDLTPQRLAQMGIEAAPLSIHFEDAPDANGAALSNPEFYALLRKATRLPTTSQVNPGQFEPIFRRHIARGDQVVGLFISSKLSGTVQSAIAAAEMVGSPDIYIVDSLTTTIGLGLLLEIAAELRGRGVGAAELAHTLEDLAGRVVIYAVVETLKYLKMGGRLSAASAALGGLLGICPVIALENGLVEAVAKARGRQAAYAKMAELFYSADRDERYGISVGHADCPEAIGRVREALGGGYDRARVLESEIGSVVGVHAGPGAAGVAFIRR